MKDKKTVFQCKLVKRLTGFCTSEHGGSIARPRQLEQKLDRSANCRFDKDFYSGFDNFQVLDDGGFIWVP